MSSFIQKIIDFFNNLFKKDWPKACYSINAAMITPLFVYNDNSQVKKQAEALKKSSNYNSVCSLVDLQEGRNYIFMGRNSVKLDSKCEKNIKSVLDAGITPILIVRNDWAVRNGWKQKIPSVGGPAPSNHAEFYNQSYLTNEKKFLKSLESYFPYIHIQLSIEAEPRESADFALNMAAYLRGIGFKNKILINPYNSAIHAHEVIRSKLDGQGIVWARSYHGVTPPPDPIWNTDGNTKINALNFKEWMSKFKNSKKEYIVWTADFANCPTGIPSEYL